MFGSTWIVWLSGLIKDAGSESRSNFVLLHLIELVCAFMVGLVFDPI